MLFNLLIGKFKDLEPIRKSCLSRFSLSEVIDDLGVWICLFDIIVVEVYDCIPIGMSLPSNTIWEYDLFLAIDKSSLNFSVIAHNLLLNRDVIVFSRTVILRREFHLIIFIFFGILVFLRFLNFLKLVLRIFLYTTFRGVLLNVHIDLFSVHLIDNFFFLIFKLFNACLSTYIHEWFSLLLLLLNHRLDIRWSRSLLATWRRSFS